MVFTNDWIVGLVLVFGCVLPGTAGYPSGAPRDSCVEMVPKHGVSAQPLESSPFTISLSSQSYRCSDDITVTLGGSTTFNGFFCQPRKSVDDVTTTGTITPLGTTVTTSKCNSDVAAITQGDATPKTTVQFKWRPAENESAVIVCTFVQTTKVFYVRQTSSQISYAGCTAPTVPTESSTRAPITTPNNGGSSRFGHNQSISQFFTTLACLIMCFILMFTH